MDRFTPTRLFNICINLELALLIVNSNNKASVTAAAVPQLDPITEEKRHQGKLDSDKAKANPAGADGQNATPGLSTPLGQKLLGQAGPNASSPSALVPPAADGGRIKDNLAVTNNNPNNNNIFSQSAQQGGAPSIVQTSNSSNANTPTSNESSSFLGIDSETAYIGGGVVVGMLILGLALGAVVARIRRRGRAY